MNLMSDTDKECRHFIRQKTDNKKRRDGDSNVMKAVFRIKCEQYISGSEKRKKNDTPQKKLMHAQHILLHCRSLKQILLPLTLRLAVVVWSPQTQL